ncbi:putative protein OS=Streptomyces gougerotii OX=53448 GN=GCM10010227_08460 PE=4 SV=1 [Streptomyces diastaticus subsp. diastaticus]|uniref:Uncharacterized protein n=1 Tax=Streptomyces griseus TaxID=1911 RepID=A0A380PBT4_STRGR|nr:Uncharacterised protein [Streptomyces griseus]
MPRAGFPARAGSGENGPVSQENDVAAPADEEPRHILVLPDRDAAEEAAAELAVRFGLLEEPQLVRDALAGEDDAEDAQWLLVLTAAAGDLDPAGLDAFAGEWDGWREEP